MEKYIHTHNNQKTGGLPTNIIQSISKKEALLEIKRDCL